MVQSGSTFTFQDCMVFVKSLFRELRGRPTSHEPYMPGPNCTDEPDVRNSWRIWGVLPGGCEFRITLSVQLIPEALGRTHSFQPNGAAEAIGIENYRPDEREAFAIARVTWPNHKTAVLPILLPIGEPRSTR